MVKPSDGQLIEVSMKDFVNKFNANTCLKIHAKLYYIVEMTHLIGDKRVQIKDYDESDLLFNIEEKVKSEKSYMVELRQQ